MIRPSNGNEGKNLHQIGPGYLKVLFISFNIMITKRVFLSAKLKNLIHQYRGNTIMNLIINKLQNRTDNSLI